MNIITIAEHSFDLSLLNKNSKVLDCGARGFDFAKWIVDNVGCQVTAIDADPNIQDPNLPSITYLNKAISTRFNDSNKVNYFSFGNGTGSYTENVYSAPADCQVHEVSVYKIEPFWDLIKLDIEGSEYDLLINMTEPIARMLSVEFHMHIAGGKSEEEIQQLFTHLSKWYTIANRVKESRHGCGENYWDVLFIIKSRNLPAQNEWQWRDPSNGLLYAWYTKSFLEVLEKWDLSNKSVFEYGGGHSTLWWADKAKDVTTLETSTEWAVNIGECLESLDKQNGISKEQSNVRIAIIDPEDREQYLNYIYTLNKKFDIIVIDGRYRDETIKCALDCIREGGIIICDNWLQEEVWICECPELLTKYEHYVFKQEGHPHWQTAYFIISKDK